MVATAMRQRGKTRNRRRSLAPKRWRSILCDIPGYDPFWDAEGCWFGLTPADLSGVRAVEKPSEDNQKAKYFERVGS